MLTKIYLSLFITLLSGLLLISCENDIPPENLLDEQMMSDILFDLHLASSYVEGTEQGYHNRQIMKHEMVDGILKERGIDREAFYESYVYYVAHPTVLDSIYERIFRRVGSLQQEYNLRP